jgi:hypothetical protein
MIKTNFGNVPLPMDKISHIVFEGRKIQPTSSSVFYLNGVGRLTGKLIEWGEKGVRVDSQIFGEIILNPEVVSSVQFR